MGGILMDRASAIRLAMLRTHSSRVQTFAAIENLKGGAK